MTIYAADALKGEHSLITGATGGIGYDTAVTLAEMGAAVTITGRRQEKLQALEQQIKQSNAEASVAVIPADIGSSDEREALVKKAVEKNGTISLLVNSAGIIGGSTVEHLKQEEMESIMHINYTSAVLLSQLVYEGMKTLGRGAIVNVSSLSGLRGTTGNTAYAGSKFALIGFTHSMALEAIPHGIRVNAVCPGYVDTEMGETAIANKGKREGRTYEEQLEAAKSGIPSGSLTRSEDVANTIAFLLTDAAYNIVGESVKISGGSVLR